MPRNTISYNGYTRQNKNKIQSISLELAIHAFFGTKQRIKIKAALFTQHLQSKNFVNIFLVFTEQQQFVLVSSDTLVYFYANCFHLYACTNRKVIPILYQIQKHLTLSTTIYFLAEFTYWFRYYLNYSIQNKYFQCFYTVLKLCFNDEGLQQ